MVADDQTRPHGPSDDLQAQPGIEVVAEAGNGREAVALPRQLRPDVCLMDIRMPEMDGIEATRQLAWPDVAEPLAIVVLTDEAVAKKAPLVEIIPGTGSGQLKKRVLRFLEQDQIKALYHRVEKDPDNFGRVFVHFRWT